MPPSADSRILIGKVGIIVIIIWFISTGISIDSTKSINLTNSNLAPPIGDSCTIFTTTIGDRVFFGNNEDYRLWGIYAWFIPAQVIWTPSGSHTTYGAIFFGFDDNGDPADGYPQGGMNDQGLCIDGNALSEYSIHDHPERDTPYCAMMAQVLWECATVEEVVSWYQTHRIGTSMPYQLHFADATGDAVVVGPGDDNEIAFTRIQTNTCLVSTNINVADPTRDVFDCWRYSTAMLMLTAISSESALTMEACRDVLDAVHQNGLYATKYSNVFDCVSRDIYLWYDRDYTMAVTMNLDVELAAVQPGAPGYTESLTLYHAVAEDGNLRYRKLALTDFFAPPPPVTLYLVIAIGGTIATIVILSSVLLLRRKHKAKIA